MVVSFITNLDLQKPSIIRLNYDLNPLVSLRIEVRKIYRDN